MNFYNAVNPIMLMSMFLVLFGTLVSVFSSSWLGVWLGMEINLLNFMVLMNPDGVFVVEPAAKYFVIQCVGSNFILMGFLLSGVYANMFSNVLLVIGLMLKSGVCPFHAWLPSVVSSSNWFPALWILTWQKLAPFVFMGWFISNSIVAFSVGSLALVGGIGGLNQQSIRGLLAYSSFVHSSWMILALMKSFWIFILYWVVYCFSVGMVFLSAASYGKLYLKSKGRLIWASFGVFMLMGLPPFLGFACKILVFLSIDSYMIFMCVVGSLISMKYYLTLSYSFILGSQVFNHWSINKSMAMSIFSILMLNFIGFMVMSVFLFV
uniref:NADH-ubiquinone oxidoreductase chain 2 n=1 Tax=Brachidontes exustus TaxID=40254 RepID=A0A0U1XA06_BRAEX|nr:NADH dehydrogenase subunit 2 [Brachidontes exustus]AIM58708.1 NADH dehydrogenase subunit 2 [Brachidontes exustus]